MSDTSDKSLHEVDPTETQEWQEALDSVIEFEGSDRAAFILRAVREYAERRGVAVPAGINTAYTNTISPENEKSMPKDDLSTFEYLTNCMRWNAIAMVMRAGKKAPELGGHIASYGSIATLFEIGFQYFFHARNDDHGGDLVYFQGHSSPGIYARAFLEGRLSKAQLENFRQEIFKEGVSSYPHPWLMPDFWQFATVSMGLGPLMSIYQANFLKYMQARGLAKTDNRHVWVYCGDGEMGEPESLGALNMAGRLKLDNLIFVINCNLQRLDGPVWGNGQIIQEYEGVFRGAGWNVIKVIWGGGWDRLFEKDVSGLLVKRMGELVDGEYQRFGSEDGAYLREHFFGKYPELLALVEDFSDEQLKEELLDGGHDPQKVYAAYAAAVAHQGQPTVILAKTIKGFGMGKSGEALNRSHQSKKMTPEDLRHFRDRFGLKLTDEQIDTLAFYKPEDTTPEMRFLKAQREKLGGYLPARSTECSTLEVPGLSAFEQILSGSGEREISSTMAFVRVLSVLLRDKGLKQRIVPIVADESRTFGMEGLFRQIGIYSPEEQKYQPEDREQLMYYREDVKGQLLQEGLSEPGAMSAWIAAATAYATCGEQMIPFYVYYSMFGFQRVGDLTWAAADMQARGFIMGATAGRTTLAGEGLQHQDGHNYLMFGMIPNCVTYDPTYSYELAVIIQDGLRRMVQEGENVFYYITLMNENYHHPQMPEGAQEGILKGMYQLQSTGKKKLHVQLLGAGTILCEVEKAASILCEEFNVSADVWSVTSFNELRKEHEMVLRKNRLCATENTDKSYLQTCLDGRKGPVIAATDYIKMNAEQVRSGIESPYYVLGTDGFGRSGTRADLRDFFEVNANMIAYTALYGLFESGDITQDILQAAKSQLHIDSDRPDPIQV